VSGPVVLTGGTGLIGGHLLPELNRAAEVRLMSRHSGESEGDAAPSTEPGHAVRPIRWDGLHFPESALDGARTIVHLAGEPVFGGLPTRARLGRLRASRIESTRNLVTSLASRDPASRPDTLVCASAVGFYGDRGDEALPESAARGSGFLADLCADWEAAADGARELGLRVVQLRFGIVLARGAGALGMMVPIFKTGLAGRLGHGQQWFPWVHVSDAAAAVLAAVSDPTWNGVVTVVAPEPVRNVELTKTLAGQLGRPAFLAAPAFAMRLALGPLADELLGSKRVVPGRAREFGFRWQYERLDQALAFELGNA
jgi:uncharacterized protein (TIGR01777 family)